MRERRRRVVLAMILVFGLAGVLVLVAPGDGDGAPVAPPEHTPGAAVG